jgi:hypothetical protein
MGSWVLSHAPTCQVEKKMMKLKGLFYLQNLFMNKIGFSPQNSHGLQAMPSE